MIRSQSVKLSSLTLISGLILALTLGASAFPGKNQESWQPRLSSIKHADIFYTRSTDGGGTFSAPLKLNDDGTATTQFFPSIAAAADGTLGVKWWDRRNDARRWVSS